VDKKSESKKVHQKVPNVRKKDVFKVGIEPKMVNSLQLKEFGMQTLQLLCSVGT